MSPLSAIGLRLWAPTQWAHPGAVPFPPQRTHKAYVQCGLRRFPQSKSGKEALPQVEPGKPGAKEKKL